MCVCAVEYVQVSGEAAPVYKLFNLQLRAFVCHMPDGTVAPYHPTQQIDGKHLLWRFEDVRSRGKPGTSRSPLRRFRSRSF